MRHPSPPTPRRRRLWARLGAWWRRRRKSYHVVADAANDPATEAMRQLMNPSSSTETPGGQETIFEVVSQTIPEEAPRRDPPKRIQAVEGVPPDILLLRGTLASKFPPLPPKKAPPTPLPTSFARQSSVPFADPFFRRRTKDSFQGSLESIDSLIESYWDPGEEDGSLATPVAANTAHILEEHVDFLKVQTQPRSVEVVFETDDWDVDEFS